MAFRPIANYEGKNVLVAAANGVTFTKGNAVVDDGNGLITNAGAATAVDIPFIAMETVTTTASGQLVLCVSTAGYTRFEADCDAAWSQTDVLTACDLASVSTLDTDASTNDLFFIEKGVGTVESTTKVEGYFVYGAPNS
jgi:hypothetical protein